MTANEALEHISSTVSVLYVLAGKNPDDALVLALGFSSQKKFELTIQDAWEKLCDACNTVDGARIAAHYR